MNIRQKIVSRVLKLLVKESRTYNSIMKYYLKEPQWTPTEFKLMAQEGYKENVYVYACVRQIAKSFSAVPWCLYKKGKEVQEIESHPLIDLWNKPNELQGGVRFRENVMAYLMIEGNSYIEQNGPKNRPPLELYSLRPDRMTILPGDAIMYVEGYIYTVGSYETKYDSNQILHLLQFDPLSDWYGMSPLKASSRSVDQNNMSRAWNVSLLQNGARPPGVLKTEKGLTDTQFGRIEEKWQDKYQGWKNAGAPIILEGGLEWQEMGLNPVDMAWLEGVKLSAREIAIAFGVPPELIGDNSNKTYSNYQEARKAFYEETILPLLDWYRDEINNWLCPMYDDSLYFDYDKDKIEALQEDRDKIWDRVNSSDDLTIDEKRVAKGYEELGKENGGNLILVPANKIPLTFHMNEEEPEEEVIEEEETEEEEVTEEDYEKNYNCFNMKAKDKKKTYLNTILKLRKPFEKTTEKIIRRQFDKERKTLVKAIKSNKKVKIDFTKEWDTVIKGIYISISEEFKKFIIKQFKYHDKFYIKALPPLEEVDPYTMEWLEKNSGEKIVNINETTKKQVQKELAEGLRQNESIGQLASRIDTLYLEQIIPKRSVVIARTEVVGASNLGSYAGAKSLGIPEMTHEWLSAGDNRTRDWHLTADGQIQPLDRPFEVRGENLMFPGDSSMGARADNVIQCRCCEVYDIPE